MSSIDLWYATRATGLVALVLLTLVMILGLLAAGRSRGRRPAFARVELHSRISALALVFLAIHVVTAVADTFVDVGITAVVVPLTSSYKPGWVALGAVSVDLLLAIGVSSLLRTRIPARAWRAIHWLAYLGWPVAVAHGLGIGTDMKLGWVLGLVATCVAAVVVVASWRGYAAITGRARLPRTFILPRRSLWTTGHGPS
jgi:predicted ferric reductase